MNFSLPSTKNKPSSTTSISIQLGSKKQQASNFNEKKASDTNKDQKIESLFSEQDEEEEITPSSKSSLKQHQSKSKSSSAMTQSLLYQKIQHEKKLKSTVETSQFTSLQDIDQWELDHEQMHQLEEDQKSNELLIENAFENMKNVISKTFTQKLSENDSKPQESKYIANLVKLAEERKKEKELAQIRRMQKEASSTNHTSNAVFVTEEYKQKLKEQERWVEEQSRQKEEESKKDVTKIGMGNFYKSLLTRNDNVNIKDSSTSPSTERKEYEEISISSASTSNDEIANRQHTELKRGMKRKQQATSNDEIPKSTATTTTVVTNLEMNDLSVEQKNNHNQKL
ncbi:hypothetical protein C9374_004564 [Naegleria lovaniensis]|uniref:Nuclear speckle splicing regulatory protein 1 N-terminal domain-containing protein n=1 Tax=Naegleria lovaniensis TaxID=51637 RepID=A0AA88GRX8_NAELO|nr:uncharacterized protein C9374_004564 [Naegleria lovaniensis]KAG2383227.1 hypothetical protein C9374_004564 [Naegleria lovaniensis]